MPDLTPQQPPDLAAIGGPIAAILLAGWTLTWAWATQAELDASIPGAIAICDPTPTRSLATVRCVWPWPATESLEETLAHELTHAALSQLTALIPSSEAAVMLEEQAVEKIGKAIAAAPARLRAPMGRALLAARARISASAGLRARGGSMAMNVDTVKKLLDAIEGGDSAAMAEVCKQLIAEAASATDAGAPAGAAEPDGDEAKLAAKGAPVAPAPAPGGADGGAVPPADESARRARLAADELEAMAAAQRGGAKEALVVNLRARLGSALTPAVEKRLMGAKTFLEAQQLAGLVTEMAPAQTQRARSGVDTVANGGPVTETAIPTVEQLRGEGFNENWLRGFQMEAKRGPGYAMAYIEQGKTSSRARVAQNGGAK